MSNTDKTKTGSEDYDLSVKQAAKALGKSTRTIHRYIDRGKLSRIYVTTENGKEIRLKSNEVLGLAAKLNDKDSKASEGDTGEEGSGPFGDSHPTQLNIREVLARYERSLYQLGEMSEKLKDTKERKEEKVSNLQEKQDRLKVRLMNRESEVEELRKELESPLTLLERLFGRRRN